MARTWALHVINSAGHASDRPDLSQYIVLNNTKS